VSDQSKDTRWGCPDWRDHTAYENFSELAEDWRWRWEFLRRTPTYRNLWVESEGEDIKDSGHSIRILGLAVLLKFQFENGLNDIVDPEFDNSAFDENPFGDIAGCVKYSSGWGEDSESSLSKDQAWAYEIVKLSALRQEWGYFPVEFDIKRPLDPQLLRAKEQLLLARDLFAPKFQQLKAGRRNKWPRHLRVIDSKDQGATHEEIYAQFAAEASDGNEDALDDFYRSNKQPKSTVSQWHKQAIEVMYKAARFL
jgi:hypothetical protein